MPKIKYVGPFDAVEVPMGDRDARVEHGHELEVSAPERDSLLTTGDWTEVKRPPAKQPKPAPTPLVTSPPPVPSRPDVSPAPDLNPED